MSEGDADIEKLYRAWLVRHEVPDAYNRWREATRGAAPLLAFTAVACDAKLLTRLGGGAVALVQQAERVATEAMTRREMSAEARATAHVVRARIMRWRDYASSKPLPQEPRMQAEAPGAEAAMTPVVLTLEDHLRLAVQDYPYFRESTARELFREMLRLGAAGLRVVGAPFDVAIMLAAARYAARCVRGLIRGEVPPREECARAVELVQQWGGKAGRNPFLIDFSGLNGAVDELVSGLYRDAATCLALATRLPEGTAAPDFGLWEDAEEYLSFAVLSVRPTQLRHMELDQARPFASAAARLAAASLAGDPVLIPTFAEAAGASTPRTVLATTRFALPDGAEPRRSVQLAGERMGAAAGSQCDASIFS